MQVRELSLDCRKIPLQSETADPMAIGRPSKYRDEYADEVVTYCAQGYSLTAFAGSIDVGRETISRWCDDHEEFRVAVTRAKAHRAMWWEGRARHVALEGGPGGQATMVIFGLKNHAPEDFSDKSQLEHTGKDGKDLIPPEADPRKLALLLHEIVARAVKGEESKD